MNSLVGTASSIATGCAWAEVTAVFTWLRGCWEGLLLQRCAGSAEKLVSPGCVWGESRGFKDLPPVPLWNTCICLPFWLIKIHLGVEMSVWETECNGVSKRSSWGFLNQIAGSSIPLGTG